MIRCASEPHTHICTLTASNKHDSLTLHLGSIPLDQVPDKCEEDERQCEFAMSPATLWSETLQFLHGMLTFQVYVCVFVYCAT